MLTRYIREGSGLFPAWIVDGHFRKPEISGLKPLYYVIDEKLAGTLLEVIDYYLLDITKAPNFDGTLQVRQKLIKADFIVKDNQALTKDELKIVKKQLAMDYDK